jgi:hypothetical protein
MGSCVRKTHKMPQTKQEEEALSYDSLQKKQMRQLVSVNRAAQAPVLRMESNALLSRRKNTRPT